MSDGLGPSPGDEIDEMQDDALDDAGVSLPWGDGSARGWVLAILVGAVLSLFEAVLGQYIAAGAAVTGALESAGGAFRSAGADAGTALLGAFAVPFDVLAGVAAGLGPLAPVFVAVAWAVATAGVGLVLYLIWRVFTWI